MKNFRALIIGCGKIAGYGEGKKLNTHAGAIEEEPRLILEACMDLDKQKAMLFANKYNCKAFSDLNAALGEIEVELVCVCTNDDSHFEITKKLLLSSNSIRVIFLEKPACSTPTQLYELKRLAASKGITIIVNHTRRFSKNYDKIRAMVSEKYLGDVNKVKGTYYGGWMHNGSHVVDTLLMILGDNIVWTDIQNVFESGYPEDPTIEITGYLVEKKASVAIDAINEKIYQLFELDIWFTEGRLRVESFDSRFIIERRTVNAEGENILEQFDSKLFPRKRTEMQNALCKICDYLEDNNPEPLNSVMLDSVEVTMLSLWQAKEIEKMKGKNEKTRFV